MPCKFDAKKFEFTQPDGSKIKVMGWGNQFNAVFETLDGYTITKNQATGFFQYATLSVDKTYLIPSGFDVISKKPSFVDIPKHLRGSKSPTKTMELAAKNAISTKSRWEERREEAKLARKMAIRAAPGISQAPPSFEMKGEYVGLCLLIQFPDDMGTIPQVEVEKFCNRPVYRGYGNNGSVFNYFFDVSGGKLKYINEITPYYTARNKKEYYDDQSDKDSLKVKELIRDALKDLKDKKFDLSTLSQDNQGYVYALNVCI